MLSLSSGYSPDYLLKEIATGRENYYTGAVAEGEPPGRWWGAGAERLGLTGLIDAQDMRAVYERFLDPRAEGFADPDRWDDVNTLGHTGRRYLTEDELYAAALEHEPDASAERRAELRVESGKAARHNVAFFDATFSVQKSVTLLHTAFEAQEISARRAGDDQTADAWAVFRKGVEDAIWAGNQAGLAQLAEHAGFSRVGNHGGSAGRFVDAHDWVVGSFFQHDSRDHDPQLHIHNAILNRVEGPDGVWRTIDGRGLYRWRAGAAAVAERTTEERLTHALGMLIATRPDGKSREVVGVAQAAMDLISSRRRAVTTKAQELIDAYEQRHGRAANGAVRDRLSRQATFATRRAKTHEGESRAQVLDRVDAQLRTEIDGGLSMIADAALAARVQRVAPQEWSPQAVVETALALVQERKAAWTASDLTRAINDVLPDYLGIPDGAQVGRLLDELATEALTYAVPLDAARPGAEALPATLRRDNGESSYQAHGVQLYCTPAHIRMERILAATTAPGGAAALRPEQARAFLDGLRAVGIELGADQAAAVRGVLTSGARVESLVGPAGTGKSFVVGAIARGWTDPDLHPAGTGRVFGLATSQIATDVLTGEGLTARNVTRWLDTQERLSAGPGSGRPQPVAEDEAWRLRARDLVVVDESAMTDTPALAQIHRRVEDAGAKLLLVGDHRQLSAVGAGGGMELLAQSGARYELTEARRFTAEWERAASLRLRDGDDAVLHDYHQQGRLLDAGTREEAEASAARSWLADTLAGRRSLLLVDDNEQAARLSASLRAELVRLGRVDEHGVPLAREGTFAGVGDLVQARFNGWDLAGHEGNHRGPINRETFQVTALRPDGGLEVTRTTGDGPGVQLVLPASYVREHLTLGYAATVHAAQGQTVDTAHAVITPGTSRAALYVGLTRGREANLAHITTLTTVADPAQGRADDALHRAAVAVLSGILAEDRRDDATRSALATATESAADARDVGTAADLLSDAAQLAATERTASWLDHLNAAGAFDDQQRSRIAAADGAASLARLLRRVELAGHDPEKVLTDAVTGRPLDDARNPTHVIYSRITRDYDRRLDPVGDTWTQWTPHTDNPEWRAYLAVLAANADRRAADLGREAADDGPAWAVEAFGAVPADPIERGRWERRAGQIAAYRELRGHDHATEALGPAPQPGQPEQYAAFRAAWRTLGRPEIDREELQLSDGQLRIRIRAHERETLWAPRYVANELAGTRQATDRQRELIALRTAEADAAASPDERARLHQEAVEAAALAGTLEQRAAELADIDDARALWLAHTAETRARAERSKAELALRHADDTEPEQRVTAEDWLAAHEADVADDERTRDITDDDVHDIDHDAPTAEVRGPELTVQPDVRDVAAAEPRPVAEDVVRTPTADEARASMEGAGRAIAEVRARTTLDTAEEESHRAAQLAQWHADDQAAEVDYHRDDTLTDEPVRSLAD